MQIALESVGIAKTYPLGKSVVNALSAVSLQIGTGEFVAIMGPSGSGKSTLLAILGGLDLPDVGDVRIAGRDLRGMSDTDLAVLRREHIGFVFQAFNLVPVLTAAENIALPLLLAGHPQKTIADRVTAVLRQVGLDQRSEHYPHELSGGQQQRVAIARALVTAPAAILADEPTGSLDSQNGQEVMQALHQACKTLGQTVVLITHDASVAAWAERVIFMKDGRLVGEAWNDAQMDGPAAVPARAAKILSAYQRMLSGEVNRA
jgi:putative ABC transport system ATP-binding protein